MITIIEIINPLDLKQNVIEMKDYINGSIISDYIKFDDNFIYMMNDEIILIEDINNQIKDNSKISIYAKIQNSDTKKFFGTLAAVALIAYTGGAAAAWLTAGTAGATAAVTGAIAMKWGTVAAFTYLIKDALTPEEIKYKNDVSDPTFGWEGDKITQQVGNPIPVIWGRVRTSGNVISKNIETIDNDQTLSILIGICENYISNSIVNTDILIDDSLITAYPDIDIFKTQGTNDQNTSQEFNIIENFLTVNHELVYGVYKEVIIPTEFTERIKINLLFFKGLYTLAEDGTRTGATVQFDIKYRLVGAASWTTFDGAYDVLDETSSPVRHSIIIPNLTSGEYEIEIKKSSTDHDLETDYPKIQNTVKIDTVSSGLYGYLKYPNLTLLGISNLKAEEFTSFPNITTIVDRGNFNSTEDIGIVSYLNGKASNNPAYMIIDVLTNIIYGAKISIDNIDTTAFELWATYCATNNLECNAKLISNKSAWEWALTVSFEHNGILNWKGSDVSVTIDQQSDAVQMFSTGQIEKGSYTEFWIPKDDLSNAISVTFFDEDSKYVKKQFLVTGNDWTQDNSNVMPMAFHTITNHTLATNRAKHILNYNDYAIKTCEFNVDIDGITSVVGDVIKVQYNTSTDAEGGRIIGATTNLLSEAQSKVDSFSLDNNIIKTDNGTHEGYTIRNIEVSGATSYVLQDTSGTSKNYITGSLLIRGVGSSIGKDIEFVTGATGSGFDIETITLTSDFVKVQVNYYNATIFHTSRTILRLNYNTGNLAIGESIDILFMQSETSDIATEWVLGGESSIQFDQELSIVNGEEYLILWRKNNDVQIEKTFTANQTITTNVIDSSFTTTSFSITGDYTPEKYNPYSFGLTDFAYKKWRITNITQSSDLKRKIEGILYDANIYTDTPVIASLPVHDYELKCYDLISTEVRDRSKYINAVSVNLDWRTENQDVGSWKVFYRKVITSGPVKWIFYKETNASDIEVEANFEKGAEYRFAVCGFAVWGNQTPSEAQYTDITISSDPIYPPDPTGLSSSFDTKNLKLSWNEMEEIDILGYEIRRKTTDVGFDSADFFAFTPDNEFTKEMSAATAYYYYIKAKDTNGDYSVIEGDFGSVSNAVPTMTTVSFNFDTKDCVLTWTTLTIGSLDFKKFVIKVYSDSGKTILLRTEETQTPEFVYFYDWNVEDCDGASGRPSSPVGDLWITVTAYDVFDQTSTPANIVAENSQPTTPSSLAAIFTGRNCELTWDASNELDFKKYEVKIYSDASRTIQLGVTRDNTSNRYTYTFEDNTTDCDGVSGRPSLPTPELWFSLICYDLFDKSSSLSNTSATNATPTTPTGLTINAFFEAIDLKWSVVEEPDVIGYYVYVGTSASPTTKVAFVQSDKFTYKGDSNTTYYARISAVDIFLQESVKTSDVSDTTIGIGIDSFDVDGIPLMDNVKWTNTSSRANWDKDDSLKDIIINYKGIIYIITPSYTTDKYIWWDKNDTPTTFLHSNTRPSIGSDIWLMATYDGTDVYPAVQNKIQHAAVLQANSITADEIAANTITAAKIFANTITADEIASNTITANEITALTITTSELATDVLFANNISVGDSTDNYSLEQGILPNIFDEKVKDYINFEKLSLKSARNNIEPEGLNTATETNYGLVEDTNLVVTKDYVEDGLHINKSINNELSEAQSLFTSSWSKESGITDTLYSSGGINDLSYAKVSRDGSTGDEYYVSNSLAIGYIFSVYMKGDVGGENVTLSMVSDTSSGANFVLTTEWARYNCLVTDESTIQVNIFLNDINSDIYVCMAQVEGSNYPTAFTIGGDTRPNGKYQISTNMLNKNEGSIELNFIPKFDCDTTNYQYIFDTRITGSTTYYIFFVYNFGSNEFGIFLNDSVSSSVNDTIGEIYTTNAQLQQLKKILITYKEDDYLKIYINGILEFTSPNVVRISDIFNSSFFVGSTYTDNRWANSLFKSINFYNEQLTADEIMDKWTKKDFQITDNQAFTSNRVDINKFGIKILSINNETEITDKLITIRDGSTDVVKIGIDAINGTINGIYVLGNILLESAISGERLELDLESGANIKIYDATYKIIDIGTDATVGGKQGVVINDSAGVAMISIGIDVTGTDDGILLAKDANFVMKDGSNVLFSLAGETSGGYSPRVLVQSESIAIKAYTSDYGSPVLYSIKDYSIGKAKGAVSAGATTIVADNISGFSPYDEDFVTLSSGAKYKILSNTIVSDEHTIVLKDKLQESIIDNDSLYFSSKYGNFFNNTDMNLYQSTLTLLQSYTSRAIELIGGGIYFGLQSSYDGPQMSFERWEDDYPPHPKRGDIIMWSPVGDADGSIIEFHIYNGSAWRKIVTSAI